MFEFWLKEFLPRFVSMEGEKELVWAYILGMTLHSMYWTIGGTVMLVKYFRACKAFAFYNHITATEKPRRANPVYLPLGVLYLLTGIFFVLYLIAVQHNYMRLSTLFLDISGLAALVNLVNMRRDIKVSESARNCDELREEVAQLREDYKYLKRMREEAGLTHQPST